MKPKIVIVLGPTAVGKSALALRLAERFGGEIVNADSQQVYRYLDIGTGKPSPAERRRMTHHLIDVVDPDEEFNVARFRQLASAAIDDIAARRRRAIVCGGTGLYLKALTHGLFEGPGHHAAIRRRLEHEIETGGLASLYQRLTQIDPPTFHSIHPNDRQRIVRALEVFEATGKPISVWQQEHRFQEAPFEVLKIGLSLERGELYDLINRRSEQMVQAGLLDEVRDLQRRGYSLDLHPLRSVGYAQMGKVVRGELTLEAALVEMQQETRHLAKRQLTWFRGDKEVGWFEPRQEDEIGGVVRSFFAHE